MRQSNHLAEVRAFLVCPLIKAALGDAARALGVLVDGLDGVSTDQGRVG